MSRMPRGIAYIHGDEIWVQSRYSHAFVLECRQIEGRKWLPEEKVNAFPLSSAVAVKALADRWNISVQPEIIETTYDECNFTTSNWISNLSLVDGQVVICFDYNPNLVNSIRTFIPSVRWDASTKTWRTPEKNVNEALKFAARFGLTVSQKLQKRQEEVLEAAAEMRRASEALDADIEIPEINGELLPYQKAGISYLKKTRKAILADQPGLGKTVQALATVVSEGQFPVVVVCPNTLKLNWEREVKKFFPSLSVSVLSGNAQKDIPRSDVIVINYDILYSRVNDIKQHGFLSLIVDESHAIKNGQKRSKCPHCDAQVRSNAKKCSACGNKFDRPEEAWTVKRTSAVMKLAKSLGPYNFVLLLTGTPITSRPWELIPQLEAVGHLDSFGGMHKFVNRYAPKRNIALNTIELNEKLRELCFVRRIKKDVYGELPDLREAVQYLSPSDDLIAWYRNIENDAVEYFASRARAIAEEEGYDGDDAYWEKRIRLEPIENLIQITALRDAVSKIKFDSIAEWLDNFLESSDGDKVIVFAEHIELVEKIYARYKDVAVKIRGGVSVKDRQAAVDRFQNDPSCRVFVANMQSASEGLTLTAASDVVFCELGWTPAMHEQCVSRCYGRANDMHGATAWYLLAPNSIDEYVYALLEKKKKIVDAVTDGVDIVGEESMVGDLAVQLARKGLGSGKD